MFCIPSRTTPQETTLGLVCTVSDAVSHTIGGEVRLSICDAKPPVQIEWLQNGSAALLQLSPDRRRASNVPPGIYTVVVTDQMENEASSTVTVQLLNIPSIVGYDVIHASGDTARDGTIRVRTRNLSAGRFLWSNGVITASHEILDVSPGVYAAIPLDESAFLHECQAAVVKPSRHSHHLS